MARKTKLDGENRRMFIAVTIVMATIVLMVMGFIYLLYSNANSIYGTEDEPLEPQEVIDNEDYYSEGAIVFVQGNITSLEDNGIMLDEVLLVRMSVLERAYFYTGETVLLEIEKGEDAGYWTFVERYDIV